MPLRARIKIAVYALLAGAVVAFLFTALLQIGAPDWLIAALGGLFGIAAVLALDAFHPKVNLFGPALVRLSPRAGEAAPVALTFDDGPVAPYTERILDILDDRGVKGTFFCVGEHVATSPEIARSIVERGHTIGNHTGSHRNLMVASPGTVYRELDAGQQVISEATGRRPRFFRCPKGHKSPVVSWCVRRRGLTLVAYGYPIWDVENPPSHELVERVLKRVAGGDIIVMHDGYLSHKPGCRDSLVAALPDIIDGIRARGLTMTSLDEAMGY